MYWKEGDIPDLSLLNDPINLKELKHTQQGTELKTKDYLPGFKVKVDQILQLLITINAKLN